ncbi:GNAT family N-acetyltransferase [Paenibacillus glacialis]|uniref:Acetyltransferase n=1 Tax=Paenibacillus glacialis TaxID=494026 RepID=A0A168LS71_9BACL|nr:GNAT family protein [Paenibacillus glacialis]OAB43769.1 acetyltransferase [Paenibacillus glacialis]
MQISNESKLFPRLETDRLILKEIEIQDASSIFRIFSNEEVMKYYGRFPMESIEEANQLIAIFNESYISDKGIRWAIILKEENRFIGTCGYHNWNRRHSRAELGYELSMEAWGKGLMNEALTEMITFGFGSMGLNRIEAVVYPENKASIGSLEKQGFKKEGLLEGYAFFRNTYQDLLMYALLKKKVELQKLKGEL